jgi:hypothetical protein
MVISGGEKYEGEKREDQDYNVVKRPFGTIRMSMGG